MKSNIYFPHSRRLVPVVRESMWRCVTQNLSLHANFSIGCMANTGIACIIFYLRKGDGH